MRPIRLLPVGVVAPPLLPLVRKALSREFRTPCFVGDHVFDPAFAHHPERNQYHSTAILEQLARGHGGGELVVGVTSVDLYIPILTFVFGEAELGGATAVVSYHRLGQGFYGLPPDDALLAQRLVKTAIHETGHTLGLTHCDDYECVMAASHAVEWLDVKGEHFCIDCRALAGLS